MEVEIDRRGQNSTVHDPASITISPNHRSLVASLPVLEILTVLILVSLALLFARPELEGWGNFAVFKLQGLRGGLESFVHNTPLRLIEPFPYALAWILGHGNLTVLALVFGGLLGANYCAARWAVTGIVNNTARWIISTLAVALPPWTDAWHIHGSAMRLASFFMLIALGAALRLRDRIRMRWLVLGTACVLFSLLTYEALFLGAAAFPVVGLFMTRRPIRQTWRSAIRMAIPVTGAALIYGSYAVTLRITQGTLGYQSYLLANTVRPIDAPARLVSYLYRTTFLNTPWTITLLSIIVIGLVGSSIMALPSRRERRWTAGVVILSIGLLPGFALSYAQNFYYLSHFERLGFPMGFGFLLLCVVLLARFASLEANSASANTPALALVVALLIGSTVNAYDSFRPYQIQRNVLDQSLTLVREHNADSVLVRDWTGLLGDMYTFEYSGTLEQAMAVSGTAIPVNLCTPKEVTRIHPALQEVRGASPLPKCDALPPGPPPALTLEVRFGPEGQDGPLAVTAGS